MLKLYRFYWDCGRDGCVEGLFIADDSNIEKAIGNNVCFGEILGKHSNVYGTLGYEDLTILTDDQDFIDKLVEYTNDSCISGYSPLDYMDELESEVDTI